MDREYRFCGFEGHVEGVLEAFRTVSVRSSPKFGRSHGSLRSCALLSSRTLLTSFIRASNCLILSSMANGGTQGPTRWLGGRYILELDRTSTQIVPTLTLVAVQ